MQRRFYFSQYAKGKLPPVAPLRHITKQHSLIPLAAGLFFPLTGHLLSALIAALAMSVSSASVVFNAWRLREATID